MHDGDARRMVGDAQVFVADRLCALGHLEHRGPAVAPPRVRVDVAAIVGEVELRLVVPRRLFHLLAEPVQIPALAGLDEPRQDTRDALANAFDRGQAAGFMQRLEVRLL